MTFSENDRQAFDNSQISNLTFIDTNLTNYQSLIPDGNNSDFFLIDSQQNGVEQITQALERYENLDSISIFSHGDVGSIQLGSTYLSNHNIDNYQEDLVAWGSALSETGDLLLYGCNVVGDSQGITFVEQIADITSADVAASNDLTGNFDLGGDWDLEVVTGRVETSSFTFSEYGSLLGISQQDLTNGITADFNGDGKSDILRQDKGTADDDNVDTAQLLIANGSGFDTVDLPESLALKGDYTNLHLGDFNGDGKSDILRQEKNAWDDDDVNNISILISTGSGFDTIELAEGYNRSFKGDQTNLHVGDFNGDGKSDIFRQKKLAWDNPNSNWTGTLYIFKDNSLVPYPTSLSGVNFQGDYTNIQIGDFNGDGKADILRQEKGEFDNDASNDAHLLISTGTSFNVVSLADFNLHGDYTNLYIGDYNGDGKDDIVRQEKNSWDNDTIGTAALLISTGNNFISHSLSENFLLKGDYTNLYVGDYNGDGKDDFLRQEKGNWDNNNDHSAILLISDGNDFNQIFLPENLNMGGDYSNLYTGDFTGDGKTDLLRQEKGWGSRQEQIVSEIIAWTENGFNKIYEDSQDLLHGNFNNVITSNVITNYLEYLEDDGLKFNFTFDANVNLLQKNAFELAGELWSEFLTDDVMVNIHVSMVNHGELPGNTIGGAIPFFRQGTKYKDFKGHLTGDIDQNKAEASGNYDDQTAVDNLDTGSTFQAISPSDGDGIVRDFDQVAMTRANAKALGFIDGDDKTLDGTIVMNNLVGTGVSWQYDYFSNRVGYSKLDFTTVAMHEIGHILGFVSVVDGLDAFNYQDQSMLNNSITTLDLFRFRQGISGQRDIRTVDTVLSLDGGVTLLNQTATGVNNIGGNTGADGYQGSHWKNEDNAGIMDPVLEMNIRRQIGELDLRAMDVIGWDRKLAVNSIDVVASDAWNAAYDTGNINRNVEVGEMLSDWRWARRGSRTRLTQQGNIAQYLAQEGFFSVGAFRESFDFSSVNPVINNNFIIVVDNHSLNQTFSTNNDLDAANYSEDMSNIDIQDIETENLEINYEEMLALVTDELSDTELSQLSLDDLGQLIEQQLEQPVS